MALPRLGQYQLALQHPATAFADAELKVATVETTPMGLPRVISGGFALTYHLKAAPKEWAVRCFHREASELQRRYQAISALTAAPPGPFVPVEYQAKGVLVENAWYPITKMPWLKAVPLNRSIETNLDPAVLRRLAQQFRALVEQLSALGVAHGDLQHGNILVDAFGNLKLVDYDGMFVPALAGMTANEAGHVNYQHPGRSVQFDATLDRFSAIVIYLALTALAADPSLWERYANGENMLFKRADFDAPDTSALFKELSARKETRPLAERLAVLCSGGYEAVPTLADFLSARYQATVQRPSAAPALAPTVTVRTQFDVIPATDTERLLRHEGDVVTVVGRVVAARQKWSRQKRPYVVVNVSPDQGGGMTLELWSQALNFFLPAGQVITAYHGRWVRATGLITVVQRRDAARTRRPVMAITLPSDVQLVSEEEARDLLDTRGAVPWYRANRRPRPLPQRPVSPDRAAAQNRIWGAPSYVPAGIASRVAAPDAVPKRPPAKKGPPRKPRAPATRPRRGKAAQEPKPAEWWRSFLPRTDGNGGATMTATLGSVARDVMTRLVKIALAITIALTLVALLITVALFRLLA